eukprot:1182102-Prymnesium_polylepis.2
MSSRRKPSAALPSLTAFRPAADTFITCGASKRSGRAVSAHARVRAPNCRKTLACCPVRAAAASRRARARGVASPHAATRRPHLDCQPDQRL